MNPRNVPATLGLVIASCPCAEWHPYVDEQSVLRYWASDRSNGLWYDFFVLECLSCGASWVEGDA